MSLRRHIVSYSLANMVNASLPFLLLPILTSYLSPEDFGKLTIVQLFLTVSFPFILLNIHGLFVIEYSNLTKDKFAEFVSTMIWIPIFMFVLIEIVFMLFQDILYSYLPIKAYWIYLVPLFALFQSMPTMIPVIYQAKKEPKNYGIFKISLTFLNFLLSIFFVISLDMGWEGRMWGIFGAFVIYTIIGLIILYRLEYLRFNISLSNIKEALKFGIPLLPHSIAGIMLGMSDKIFLANMLSLADVGLYSVAFQVASGMLIVMTSINQAWVPHLYEKLNKSPDMEAKQVIVSQTYKIMLVMIITTIVFSFLVPVIYKLFIDSKYIDGLLLAQILTIGFLFQGFYFMVTNYIFYVKKTYLLSIITVCSAVTLLILNYYFIRNFALFGSAIAMILGYLLLFILTWFLSNRVYPMPWLDFSKKAVV